MARLTTVCAMRSDTVGIPSFLVPPFAFGISTCLTGGGKYDPDDIRFHSLYKFLDRFSLEHRDGFPVDAGSAPVGLDLLVCLPYCALRNNIRFRRCHVAHPRKSGWRHSSTG